MSIFAIADLHLSLTSGKPMDVFGSSWENYVERLEKAWRSKIRPEDTVLIPGDISWAMTMDEALADFQFIESLPGTKILSKGNHDFWWNTNKKVEDFFAAHGLTSMKLLRNNGYIVENTLIAGTRGWLLPENPESKAEDEKIYLREVGRLERSLKDSIRMYEESFAAKELAHGASGEPVCGGAGTVHEVPSADAGTVPEVTCGDDFPASGVRKVAMLHYPPVYDPERENGFTQTLEKYGFMLCLYGHLHGRGHLKAFNGEKNGVEYRLIAADYLRFDPMEV